METNYIHAMQPVCNLYAFAIHPHRVRIPYDTFKTNTLIGIRVKNDKDK